MHRPHRGRQRAETRVLERLPRLEDRKLTDHPRTLNLLDLSVAVGDDPLAAQELRGLRTAVRDAYVIREVPGAVIATVGKVFALDLNPDSSGGCVGHDDLIQISD